MTKHAAPRPHITRLYRNATVGFFAVVVAVAGSIAFVSFSTTTIRIGVSAHAVTKTLSVTVSEHPAPESGELNGLVRILTVEGSKTADAPESGATVDDYAHGTVTFHNDWTKPQPLAERTRLKASSNGIIYRTTSRVDVPVGGTAQATVVADTPGAVGNVGPDRFEIVALWPGLKEEIYATSSDPMTGGTKTSSQLTQATIDETSKTLEDELIARAASDAATSVPENMVVAGRPYTLSTDSTSSAKAGDAVSTYTVASTLRYALVSVARNDLERTAREQLSTASTDSGRSSGDVDYAWNLTNIDEKNGVASLDLTLTTTVRPSASDELMQPGRFAGKTKSEVEELIRGIGGVKSVEVSIGPFWASRTPSSPQRISVSVYDAT